MTRNFAAVCGLAVASVSAMGAERVSLLEQKGATASFRVLGEVEGARRVAVPETGGHLLVQTASGRVLGWGQNLYGQLGVGDRAVHGGFVDVGLTDVVGIAAGAEHSLVVKRDGTVWAWGANTEGQLGDGTLVDRAGPGAVPGLRDVSMVAAGALFSVALKKDGTVWVFGSNWSGVAPGDGRKMVTEAVRVDGLTGVVAIGTRGGVGYGLDGEGRVWRWGVDGVRIVEDASWKAVLEQKAAGLASLAPWVGVSVTGGMLRVGARAYPVAGAPLDVTAGWAVAVVSAPAAVGATRGGGVLVTGTTPTGPGAVTAAASTQPNGAFASDIVMLVVSDQSTYAMRMDSGLRGWGDNSAGQLGDGSAVRRAAPTCSLATGLQWVSSSNLRTVAVGRDGRVWSWGMGYAGSLGDGDDLLHERWTPYQVPNLTNARLAAAGAYHSIALKSDGTVWTWGDNSVGQLGNGTGVSSSTPVQVPGLTGILQVAAGLNHSVAVGSDGSLYVWGANGAGQLGLGDFVTRTTPTKVPGVSAQSVFAMEERTFVVQSDGTLWGWGDARGFEQVSSWANAKAPSPVHLTDFTDVVQVASANGVTFLLQSSRFLWSFRGAASTDYAGAVPSPALTQMTSAGRPIGVAAGTYHFAVLGSDNRVRVAGANTNGVLGIPTVTNSSQLIEVTVDPQCWVMPPTGQAPRTRVAAGPYNMAVLSADGSVWMSGANGNGEVGDGTIGSNVGSPVKASGLTGMVMVAPGGGFTLALGQDGLVRSWGANYSGELGDGTTTGRTVPGVVPGLTSVTQVSAWGTHAMALRSDGTVWCWGLGNVGQIGDGAMTNRLVPTQVVGLSQMTQIAAGGTFSLALKSDGTVWMWGAQYGETTVMPVPTPVQVEGLSDVHSIAAGGYAGMALKNDGTVWIWTRDDPATLGSGPNHHPVRGVARVPDLADVVSISVGHVMAAAVKSDGTVWTWGNNVYGQVGYDVTQSQTALEAPTQVPLYAAGGVYFGATYGSGWMRDGRLLVWGQNPYGEFGLAEPAASATPILSGFQPGFPIAVGPTGATPVSGDSSAQTFDVKFRNEGGFAQLQWAQMLMATAPDGGGAPYCFLHYDVAGNGLWLYGDGGFFLGPVAPGTASNSLQNSFCAVDPAATSISGSGADLTLHARVIFKQDASRNIYLRTMSRAEEDSGWILAGTWDSTALVKVAPAVSPNAGGGAAATFAAQYSEASGLPSSTGGWVQLLVAAASDGGGQPFCFVHYDRGGNGLWMYSSDVGFFLGPVSPGVSSTALASSACSMDSGGTTVQDLHGTLAVSVPVSFTGAMSGAKKIYQRSMDALQRDSGWIQTGSWVVP